MQVLQKKLQEEKQKLESGLERFAKSTGTPGEYETTFEDIGHDMEDSATEVEKYVDDIALEQTLESKLHEVNAALAKIENGTYGVCEKCGKSIDIKRLEVYPAAKTCVDHNE